MAIAVCVRSTPSGGKHTPFVHLFPPKVTSELAGMPIPKKYHWRLDRQRVMNGEEDEGRRTGFSCIQLQASGFHHVLKPCLSPRICLPETVL